jgi:cullin-associated NEDD8-dissociated protein 1
MQFFANAQQMKGPYRHVMCADPVLPAAGTSCCTSDTATNDIPDSVCLGFEEKVTHATAVARCAAESKFVCLRHNKQNADNLCGYGADARSDEKYTWIGRSCALQIQIDVNGMINVVHHNDDSPADGTEKEVALDSQNIFRVNWLHGMGYPTITVADCSTQSVDPEDAESDVAACTVHGNTCICETAIEATAVFTTVPTRADAIAELHIGAPSPDVFDTGTYIHYVTQADVEVWTTAAGELDMNTIFRVVTDHGVTLHLSNKVSVVAIPGSNFKFRNPPAHMAIPEATTRDAAYETEALLDHLFHHHNTAPFLAHRVIQRMVTSNPSPRYVRAVVDAFSSGQYGGTTYSGQYGDLGAMLAAVLLDREARSATLDLDPTHGALREPLIKVFHVLRALGFKSKGGREIELRDMHSAIGMQAHRSPSVFNFYLPEYQPSGPVAAAGLVSPESQIATAPLIIGFLNGMVGLMQYGLTSCANGFGSTTGKKRWCSTKQNICAEETMTTPPVERGDPRLDADADWGPDKTCTSGVRTTVDGHMTFAPVTAQAPHSDPSSLSNI